MRKSTLKLLAALTFLAAQVFAIGHTKNDSPWLGVWFVLFIFAAIPITLLAARDFILSLLSARSESFRAWLMLHVCAVFAAGIGLLLGHLAKASGHPKAELHQWLVVVLPGLVYITPVLLALHSGSLGFLSVLTSTFRKRTKDKG